MSVLRAEWTKFRSVRGWVIGIVAAAVVMDLLGLLVAGGGSIECGGSGPSRTGAACRPALPKGPDGEYVNDSFYFVHRPLTGNGSLTVRVAQLTGSYSLGQAAAAGQPDPSHPGLEPWSKAGIMIKSSLRQGSAYAAMLLTGGHGVRLQYDYTHDVAGLPGSAPRWLRLTRTGDTITGADSADGVHWTRVGAVRLPGLGSVVQVGMFAASPQHTVTTRSFGGSTSTGGPSVATGVFDHVPAGGWAGTPVGADGGEGPQPSESFHQDAGRLTVIGAGDIVPIVPGGGGGPIATLEAHLLGAFAALIFAVVIGVRFITAEYRRGLIRITFAAVPRRAHVLAAKAAVLAGVTFSAGLVAAVIAVAVGVRLSRDAGNLELAVSGWTEARVIVGTAALLAVSAVLALSVGTMLRQSGMAVAAAIVGIVLPYLLATANVLPLGASEWLLRITPAAGFAIQQSIPHYAHVTADFGPPSYLPLSPWAGFGVLCAYAAAGMAGAVILLRRRDA
jgi:regulation of enolase protein 1 (concanavalin A-like superfamily)/ABC-type transport system involved in multi-copper enzyme maturation permease subunit